MQPQKLIPTIRWAQKQTQIYLTILLRDIKNQSLCITSTNISFTGESSQKTYSLNLQLYHPILQNENERKVQKTGASMFIQLTKQINTKWPRLNKQNKRLSYVLVDWDRWDEDSEEEELRSGGDVGSGGEGEEEDDEKERFDGGDDWNNDRDEVQKNRQNELVDEQYETHQYNDQNNKKQDIQQNNFNDNDNEHQDNDYEQVGGGDFESSYDNENNNNDNDNIN